MVGAAPGLRERKRSRTRLDIESAALRLFAEHGFDDVTVEDVCDTAAVSPATFYRYFGTKDEVVFAYRDEFLDGLRAALDSAADEKSPSGQLRAVLLEFARFLDTHAQTLALRDQIVLHHPLLLARTLAVQRDWESELAAGLARARRARPDDLGCQLHAALGLSVLRVAMRQWRAGKASSLPAATRRALRAAADVLAASEFAGDLR